MGDLKGFMTVKRKKTEYRPVCERVQDFREVALLRAEDDSVQQAARCMDCGTPFCSWGCPVGNQIPEWNDAMFQKNWKKAYELLSATNNLPEITGRLCPAPCEFSCVLGISDEPVSIRENELAIIEYAFQHGYVQPEPPKVRTGINLAVIGSGPAGLACAAQLNKAGHQVTVFERDDEIGGILRYGIPDFKLEKDIIDRRVAVLRQEGVTFRTGVEVGGTALPVSQLRTDYAAVCLTGGSREPRDLNIPGRDLNGIYYAMEFLTQANMIVAGKKVGSPESIEVRGKRVVVIGGGDTGADCVGTSHRQGAGCVVQIEVMPKPPESRTEDFPWPYYPLVLRSSTSHEEGGDREWAIMTKRFIGENGLLKKLECVRVEFVPDQTTGRKKMQEVPDSVFEIEADVVILAIGFLHPEHGTLLSNLGVTFDERGNVTTDSQFQTTVPGVFAAGDLRRGQSLIVWAIREGRSAAHHIDAFVRKAPSMLPLL